jgi:hypothetical protein
MVVATDRRQFGGDPGEDRIASAAFAFIEAQEPVADAACADNAWFDRIGLELVPAVGVERHQFVSELRACPQHFMQGRA